MRSNLGFTLIEVLVSLLVGLLALSGLLALQLGTTKANVDTMNRYRAMSYAEELMEEIRQVEWRQPCAAGCALGCDGTVPARSVPTSIAVLGMGCEYPTGVGTSGRCTIGSISSSAKTCTYTTTSLTAGCCDTAAQSCSYQDQIRPNTASDSCTSTTPTGNPDTRQTCDAPALVSGTWVGGPPNPTDITFWRCVEMEDIAPSGPPATLRRITVHVYWDDAVSLARGTDRPHHIDLESERRRQP